MSCANTQYNKEGLPEDLIEGNALKVSNANDLNTDSVVAHLLNEISSTNKDILTQLILLNARIEEAFNTKIEEIDIE